MDRLVERQMKQTGTPCRGDALLAAHMYAEAQEEFSAALLTADENDRERRAELLWNLAWCLHQQGDNRRANAVLEDALEELDGVSISATARIHALSGWTQFFLGDYKECLRQCEQARSELAPTTEHAEMSRVLRWMGYAERRLGNHAAARSLYQESVAFARRGGTPSEEALGISALGLLHRQAGNLDTAAEHLEESLKVYRALGEEKLGAHAAWQFGLVELYRGRGDRAGDLLKEALGIYRRLESSTDISSVHIAFSRVHTRKGDWDTALNHAAEALELAENCSHPRGIVLAYEELGDLARLAGDMEKAAEHYRTGMELADSFQLDGDLVYELAWRIALVQMTRGDLADAEASARRALDLAGKHFDRRECGNARRTLARILAKSGRTAEASVELDKAVEVFRRIGTPYELGRTHLAATEVLPADDGEEARVRIVGHLFEARRIFAEVGALRDLEDTERLLKEFGLPGPPGGDPPPRRRKRTGDAPALVTGDPSVREAAALAQALADEDYTVLIEGETGTGKELLARILHLGGWRAGLPFIAVNCAAIPEHLLESELFGHKRGSFTGANADHPGILPATETGTVLLDEIAKAGLEFQSKLLRVIEEREVRPVGSIEPVPIKARILCAANNDTRVLAEEGRFLPDLYYRLSGFRLRLPPLRERPGDVDLLVDHFLGSVAREWSVDPIRLSSEARTLLRAHRWPGNVRELRNTLESAAFYARSEGEICAKHLPRELRGDAPVPGDGPSGPAASLQERMQEVERREIVNAIARCDGVKAKAACSLGISRKGLRDRMRRLDIA
ncbi:MAG: sigma 54-interacting transcriptional regulator [Gemmatimonadota bacterium]|nr:sigma 54-interacting transcriptional regulator [Gemmatimonadota bacterium]